MRERKLKYLYITVCICLSQSARAIVYGDWMNDMAAPLRFHAWVIYSAECNLQNTTPPTVVGTIEDKTFSSFYVGTSGLQRR